MNSTKKRIIISICAAILLLITISSVITYLYFFQGNIVSKVPDDVKEKCNIKEEKFQERSVFILSTKQKNKKSSKVIFFLHGGSYVAELSNSHWQFLSDFVQDTGATIIVPDYPLTPQYQYTHVFEMITPLYKEILSKVESKDIILMGDSAGGGMALALLEKIGQEGVKKPSKAILISPWLDVTMENPEIKKIQEKDKMLNTDLLKLAGISYAGNEKDTKNYLVSPIYGPIENLDNIIIYTGTNDILNPDVHKLENMAKEKRNKN